MTVAAEKWRNEISPMLRMRWSVQRSRVLRTAIGLMTIAAVVWLGYEFWRLLWQQGFWGAIDLRTLRGEILRLTNGGALYGEIKSAAYPPATFVMLWPLLGWLGLDPTRGLWAITTVAAIAWLVYLAVTASRANTPLECVFVALVPLSLYATGAAIGNGQLITHILPALVSGILLLDRSGREKWWQDGLAAALLLWALIKPSISVPFFWIVLFVPRRRLTAWLVVLGYVALTLFAASFQNMPLAKLFQDWITFSPTVFGTGYADLYVWLRALGLIQFYFPLAFVVLATLGLWVFLHRDRDYWILLSVTAIVARFWIYHAWYDDLLLLLPMIALYRIAKNGPSPDAADVAAGVLFAISLVVSIAPGGLYLLPSPFDAVYVAIQLTVWLAVLVLLLVYAAHARNVLQIETAG